MELAFTEIIYIVFFVQSLFLIFALHFIPRKNKSANKVLQLLLGLYAISLFDRVSYVFLSIDQLFQYSYMFNGVYYLIGPLIYLYFKKLLLNQNNGLIFYHYVPVIIYMLYSIVNAILFDTVSEISGYFYVYSFIFETTSVVSITFYLIKSKLILNLYKRQEMIQLSFNQNVIKYLNPILICVGVCVITWTISIIGGYLFGYRVRYMDLVWMTFGIQIYIIGFYSLKHPEIFKITLLENKSERSEKKERLSKEDIEKIQKLIDLYLDKNKGYLREDLSLSILAKEVGTTSNSLSWLLNNIYQKTFYQFINEYRIKEFLARIDNNDHKDLTLSSIAYEVGFKSKSTFYKVFKEVVKDTPSDYIKKKESNS